LTYSAEANLSASSVDELTKGLVEDALATCNLYGIELTRERCACIEQAAHSHLAIQKQFVIQSQNRDRPEVPHQAVEALQAKIERTKFSAMREISVLIEKARVEDTTRRQAVAKQASSKPPQRFAVGTKVRVCNPGIDGVVTHMNEERTAMSEYWHVIQTTHGERKEPGCNLQLIPEPITNSKPWTPKIADNIHFHGPNPRLNVNSTDNSTNIVSTTNDEVFVELSDKANSILDEKERERVLARIAEMQYAHKSGGFLAAYQHFISVAADHMTVFAPLLPALAQMLSGN
jgi:hypothetical protein